MQCRPLKVSSTPLAITEVVNILQHPPEDGISTVPPVKPKAGEVYLYTHGDEVSKKDDWRCDQYRWINQGVKKLPKKSPKVKKSYFHISTPKGASCEFMRHAYELVPPTSCVVIQYLGDEKAAVEFPHGNRRHSDRNHVRTCPSVLQDLTKQISNTSTSKAYKSAIAKVPPTSHIPVLQPRDSKQVENIRMKQLQQQRISHDALYNLHELAIDMPDFIHHITTYPDLVCVCGRKDILKELDRVLLLKSPSPQLLSYDTTFNLGDFYVSVLSFRHTLFKEAPVIPAAFLIHERKLQTCHSDFFVRCTKLASSLSKTSHPFVSDEEQSIINAIAKHLPNMHNLRCWNHLFRDASRWLRGHGATSNDISVYNSDLRDLFHQPTQEEYKEKFEQVVQKWSGPFREYYANSIEPDIQSVARWAIEPYGVYNPYSGITNNQAESLNHVLKQLQGWKEAPVDCMALALYHLQSYYMVEIARGQQGAGNYNLHSQYASLKEAQLMPSFPIYSPDEIVEKIKGNKDESTLNSSSTSPPEVSPQPTHLSQQERAKQVVQKNRISVDTKLHTFTVLGTNRPHVVTLFPKETCSCPSTSTCYHILAAKMSIGLQSENKSGHKLNLTQLRRNARSRAEKKTGRKQPRPGDCDIIPAPDALCAQQNSSSVTSSIQNGGDGSSSKTGGESPLANLEDGKDPLSITDSEVSTVKFEDGGYDNPEDCEHKSIKNPYNGEEPSNEDISFKSGNCVDNPFCDKDSENSTNTQRKQQDIKQSKSKKRAHSLAYTRDAKRRQKQSASKVYEGTYDVDSHVSKQKMPQWWIKERGLRVTDKNLLQFHHKWLNDRVINAAQQMLKQKYGCAGLQDVILADTLSMEAQITEEFVQILNVGECFWITLSTFGCQPGTIKVYDSGEKNITYRTQEHISSLLFTEEHTIRVEFMSVQHQYGRSECGLFAVAFATEICEGIDPTTCVFRQPLMRNHLLTCIEKGEIERFPLTKSRRAILKPSKEVQFDVHCYCRMPHDERQDYDRMIMCMNCRVWFHDTCITTKIPENYWTPGNREKWYCGGCKL